MTTKRAGSAIRLKNMALRDHLWPGNAIWLWDRNAHKGFTTIPKTMPLILKIMDEMTKGAPVSSTYLALWCSTWDNSFVTLSKPGDLAVASGFGGQRGEHTWLGRVKKLQELGFITVKAGKSGPMSHALIFNPHWVIRYHHDRKTPGLMEASYTALLELALEVGANDMLTGPPSAPVASAPTAPAAPTPTPAPATLSPSEVSALFEELLGTTPAPAKGAE